MWSKRFGGDNDQEARAVAVDEKGNAWVTGVFRGSISFQEGGGHTLTSLGEGDVFLTELGPTGALRWGRAFGGPNSQEVWGIAIADGSPGVTSAILTGDLIGSMDLGQAGLLVSAGDRDGFVLRVDQGGHVSWGRAFGGPGDDSVSGVAIDPDGNAVVTGYFHELIHLGDGEILGGGGRDAFVAKLQPSGEPIFGEAFGGARDARGDVVAVDALGQITVLGAFEGEMNVGADVLTSAGSSDLFVVRLRSDGTRVWARRFGGASAEEPGGLAVTKDGDVFVGASLEGSADFGLGMLKSAGGRDAVLLRLASASGDPLWTRVFGDFADQMPRALAFTGDERLLVTGDFRGTLQLGSGGLVSLGGGDIFLAELDP